MWLFIKDGRSERKHPGSQAGPGGGEWAVTAHDWNTETPFCIPPGIISNVIIMGNTSNIFYINPSRLVPLWNAFCSCLQVLLGRKTCEKATGPRMQSMLSQHLLWWYLQSIYPPKAKKPKLRFLLHRERILKRSDIQKWWDVLEYNVSFPKDLLIGIKW